jgi:hypothetical protein
MTLQSKRNDLPDIEILGKRFKCNQWYVSAISPSLNTLRIIEVDTTAKTVKYRLPEDPGVTDRFIEGDVPTVESVMKELGQDYRIHGKVINVVVPFNSISIKFFSREGKLTTLHMKG